MNLNELQQILVIYYIVINLVAFAMMYIDKQRAKKDKWRISEQTLFLSALLGGGFGYYAGMYTFHHKTRKFIFQLVGIASIVLHLTIITYVFR